MTRHVQRDEIVDYQTWSDRRDEERATILKIKEPRRVHVGEHFTFLFENHETVRYQIQEMMRVEQIVREKDILHEIETYNELIGGPGQLGAVLLIEIDDPEERKEKLSAWVELPRHLYVELEDGTKVPAEADERQGSERKLSSVQYLTFDVMGQAPVAVGVDHPDVQARTELTDAQRKALAADAAA